MSETNESPAEAKKPLYRIGRVNLSYAHRARVNAVLGETVREKDSSGTLPERIQRRVVRLASWWRYRVKQLEDDGWALTSGNPGRYWSLMRCRPGLGNHTVKQTSGACRQDWICPFCWAREVAVVWRQIKAGFDRRPAGVAYVLLSRKLALPRGDRQVVAQMLRVRASRGRRLAWDRLCYQLKTRSGGVYESVRLLPNEDGTWTPQLRQLLLIPAEAWDRLQRSPQGLAKDGLRATRNPKLRDLSNAVSWLLRYPNYLLTSPPKTIRELAQLRSLLQLPGQRVGQRRRGAHLRAGLGLFNAQSGRPAGKAGAAARAAAAALESDLNGAPSVPKTDPLLATPAALQESPREAFNRLVSNSPYFRDSPSALDAAVRFYVELVHLGFGERVGAGEYVDALHIAAARHCLSGCELAEEALVGVADGFEADDRRDLLLRACANVVDRVSDNLGSGLRVAVTQVMTDPSLDPGSFAGDATPEEAVVCDLDLEAPSEPEPEPEPALAPRARAAKTKAAPAPEPAPAPATPRKVVRAKAEPSPAPEEAAVRMVLSEARAAGLDAAIRARTPVAGAKPGAVLPQARGTFPDGLQVVLALRNDPAGPYPLLLVQQAAGKGKPLPRLRSVFGTHTFDHGGRSYAVEVVHAADA